MVGKKREAAKGKRGQEGGLGWRCIAIAAQKVSDSEWEGPITQCILAPAILTAPPPHNFATGGTLSCFGKVPVIVC